MRDFRWKRMLSLAAPVAVLVALVAYALAAHLVFASGEGTRLVALFAWAPLAVTALWLLWSSPYRRIVVLAVAGATVALWVLWPDRGLDVGLVYLGQYVAAQMALCALFGRTLLAGHEPLVTRLARLVHKELPPPITRYTRHVTIAWTLFFAGMGVVAVLVYAFAPAAAWSVFVNLLTLPCVCAVFVIEYIVRRLRFPWFGHASILAGVRAFGRALDQTQP